MPRRTRDLTMSQQLARGPIDLPFLMLVVMLATIGVIMVFSASFATAVNEERRATYYFERQAIFAVMGLVAMYIISRINYQHFRMMSLLVLGISFLLLLLVLVPGVHTNRTDGVRRWIRSIGPIPSFQPSEVVKLGVVLFFSARMSKRGSEKKRQYDTSVTLGQIAQKLEDWGFMELVPYGVILLAIAVLMYFEPHLSGTILILVPAAAILFVGGVKLRWFAMGGAAAGGLLLLMLQGYQSKRILVWKDPWAYSQDGGYQIIQSLYAIGSGGLFGVGFGQSRQKQLFLPEP